MITMDKLTVLISNTLYICSFLFRMKAHLQDIDKRLQDLEQKINQIQRTVSFLVNSNQKNYSEKWNILNIFIVVFLMGLFEAALFFLFKK